MTLRKNVGRGGGGDDNNKNNTQKKKKKKKKKKKRKRKKKKRKKKKNKKKKKKKKKKTKRSSSSSSTEVPENTMSFRQTGGSYSHRTDESSCLLSGPWGIEWLWLTVCSASASL